MPVSVCLYGGGHGAVFDLGIVLCFAEPAFAIMECRLGWRRNWMSPYSVAVVQVKGEQGISGEGAEGPGAVHGWNQVSM